MILSNAELRKITQKKFPVRDLAADFLAQVDEALHGNEYSHHQQMPETRS